MAASARLGMVLLSRLRRITPFTRDWLHRRCLLHTSAPHRHSGHSSEIALAIAACEGFEKTLVHDIGKRHWGSDFLRRRKRQPQVFQRERKPEPRWVVAFVRDGVAVGLVCGC